MISSKDRMKPYLPLALIALGLITLLWALTRDRERSPSADNVQLTASPKRRDDTPALSGPGRHNPSASCSIEGQVSTPDGVGLEAVEICAQPLIPRPSNPGSLRVRDMNKPDLRLCARTNARGRYKISGFFAGEHPRIIASLDGYVVRLQSPSSILDALAPDEHRQNVNLVAIEGALLEVQVEDQGGGPIVGASIKANNFKGATCDGTSDGAGIARLWCLRKEYKVYAKLEGYQDTRAAASAPGKVLMVLKPGASISGRLITQDGRRPPPQAVG